MADVKTDSAQEKAMTDQPDIVERLLQVREFLLSEYGSAEAEAEGYPVDRECRPAWDALHAALSAIESAGVDMRSDLRQAEFRLALRRINERYPPDTIAGRLAADVLAKYPTGYENADRENDDELFPIPEIDGLRFGPIEGWSVAPERHEPPGKAAPFDYPLTAEKPAALRARAATKEKE